MLNNLFNFQFSLGSLCQCILGICFTEHQAGVFLPWVSVSLQCSDVFPEGEQVLSALTMHSKTSPLLHTSVLTMHSILYPCVFPLHLFVFSLSFSKCGSLALYTHLPDEIVVMCNENDISYLDWQYMIQQISLLYSASCWHPKSPDTYTSLTSSQLSTQDTPVHGKNSF